jgi:alpha-mannosidase
MAHIPVKRRNLSIEKWSKILFEKISEYIIKEYYPIDNWIVRTGQYFPDGYEWRDKDFTPIIEGQMWGGPDVTSVFKSEFYIPSEADGKELWFYMLTPTEVLVSENGKYLDGLDPNRQWFKYLDSARLGEEHHILLEAYTRSKPDDDRNMKSHHLKGCIQKFRRPALVVIDHELLALKYDLDTIYQSAYSQYMENDIKKYLQYHIEEIIKLFPVFESGIKEFGVAVPKIKQYIEEKIFNATHPYGKHGNIACVAHSHLDVAYHWKVGQTVQKNARTTLIQLRLMERYQDFKYSHSQAWMYESLEKYYPDLFNEVSKKIIEGQWEVVGGMYVEADCNLISAESMIRQILYGKQYFLEKFNCNVDNCWLPDVFGNNSIMPQILKLGEIDYFISNKIFTWNDTNLFPHNNFIWKGIDGSEVFACIPPYHFVMFMTPDQVIENWTKFQDKHYCSESLQMFGYGDGGSGVTVEMIEYFKRQQQLPGIPKMRLTSGKEYLHSVFRNAESFPVWDGELYLEMHRGTFTTKGELKRYNRKGEFLAQETETLMALASLVNCIPYIVQEQIKVPWKKLLLNQAHDILPGSHTAPVTVDAVTAYREMNDEFNMLKNHVIDYMTNEGTKHEYVLINTSSDKRGKTAYLDIKSSNIKSIKDDKGTLYPIQKQVRPDGKERYCAAIPEVSGFSFVNFITSEEVVNPVFEDLFINKKCMQNEFFRLSLDDIGHIISIYDRLKNREIVPEGREVNEWQLFEDCSGIYNAWDILKTYENQKIVLPDWDNIEVVESGLVSIALRLKRTFGKSKAVQIVRMYKERARIDFETWVDWHESEKLLKVAFPVNVKSRVYSVDTSAGVFERMNHQNTSWEQAKFEVPCHKWVNLSEGLFGVSLMNDCKYGCDVQGNVMRLSLLRAPIRPDRESDRGEHYFTYSLFTHSGNWQNDGLVEEAYDLNYPLVMINGRKFVYSESFKALKVNSTALKCQAFKMAEDGSRDIIVRLIELYGSRGDTSLKVGFDVAKAFICNILEKNIERLNVEDNEIRLAYKPYQIISIRLCRN